MKLKLCPFCGGYAYVAINEETEWFYAMCSWCEAKTKERYTEEGAAEEWNNRVDTSCKEFIGDSNDE